MLQSFFNKVAVLRPATLLKKRLWHRRFPAIIGKFFKTPIFIELLRWLLLFINVRRGVRRPFPIICTDCMQFYYCIYYNFALDTIS